MDMQPFETDFDIKRRFLRRPYLGLWLLAIGIMLFLLAHLFLDKVIALQTSFGAALFAALAIGGLALILLYVLVIFAIGHGIALIAYAEKHEHTGIGGFTIVAGLLALAYLWTAL